MNFELNNEIDQIADNLYLGDLYGAQNIEKLKNLGIKKVLKPKILLNILVNVSTL